MQNIKEFQGNTDPLKASSVESCVKVLNSEGNKIAEFLFTEGVEKAEANAKLFVAAKSLLESNIDLLELIKEIEKYYDYEHRLRLNMLNAKDKRFWENMLARLVKAEHSVTAAGL